MKSVYRVQFEQAVEEAKTCMDYRLNPDKSTSTPRKLFDKVAQLRPKEYAKVSVHSSNVLASSPGPLRGRERAWYAPYAHALNLRSIL